MTFADITGLFGIIIGAIVLGLHFGADVGLGAGLIAVSAAHMANQKK